MSVDFKRALNKALKISTVDDAIEFMNVRTEEQNAQSFVLMRKHLGHTMSVNVIVADCGHKFLGLVCHDCTEIVGHWLKP